MILVMVIFRFDGRTKYTAAYWIGMLKSAAFDVKVNLCLFVLSTPV